MKNSRLISFVLSCAMVFALVVPALATDIETGTTVRGNSLLHALDTKNQEFTILEESTPALSGLPVSYQYTIERTTGEPETVQVTLNLSIQGNCYSLLNKRFCAFDGNQQYWNVSKPYSRAS